MAVPKRKKSRANTHARRSQWKAEVPTLVKTVENGKVTYSLPHRAKVVEDSAAPPCSSSTRAARSQTSDSVGDATGRAPAGPSHLDSDRGSPRVSTPEQSPEGLLVQLGIVLDAELLELALTHRSYAYEHGGIRQQRAPRVPRRLDPRAGRHGHAVPREPATSDEGDLAKRRASLVSTVQLSRRSRSIIGLGEFPAASVAARCRLTGRSIEGTRSWPTRSKRSSAPPTSIAGPHEPRRAWCMRHHRSRSSTDPDRFGAAMDPKTSLQESAGLIPGKSRHAQLRRSPTPAPTTTSVFHAVGHRLGKDEIGQPATGSSKKMAEMAAALEAWTTLSAPAHSRPIRSSPACPSSPRSRSFAPASIPPSAVRSSQHVEILEPRSADGVTRPSLRRFLRRPSSTGATDRLAAVRRGKFLWFPFEPASPEAPRSDAERPAEPLALVAHLGMSGQVLLRDRRVSADDRPPPHPPRPGCIPTLVSRCA